MAKENATTRSQRQTTKNTTSSTLKLTLSLTPRVNLSNNNASLENYITVCAKLIKIYPSQTILNQGRTKTVAKSLS